MSEELSLEQLGLCDGGASSGGLLYVALKGTVYDVAKGREFYGPGKPYNMFAGKDATVALAKMSLQEEDTNRADFEEVLSEGERKTLASWVTRFDNKYNVVGIVKWS
eukprot:CAMPEP_0113846534 /NCGR_PEP_ID=MMETSP0372-20130328/1358_1 /TAXON_ID=340204 /ORGANISM="Lankesteria abbotti" /LENGTH=106 /DNA_ID=CAMNT_0000815683 /DNA_START=46 /DNA_END=366 /DNA_ORIENTATION=+ /assembly_acc=CAM_ASM_000359